jgi:Helix-turn-helix domain
MTETKAWRWRKAIQSAALEPSTKLVLYNLSLHMNQNGGNCFPSTRLQAKETGLSERAVCTHLERAEAAGFISKRAKGDGKNWKHHEYVPLIPATENISAATPTEGTETISAAKEADATEINSAAKPDGAETVSVRKCEATENNDSCYKPFQSKSPDNSLVNNTAGKSGKKKAEGRKTEPTYTPEFDAFWNAYPQTPNKRGFDRPKIFEAWNEQLGEGVTAAAIMTGLSAFSAEHADKQGNDRKFICSPVRFLTERRFEIEAPAEQDQTSTAPPAWSVAMKQADPETAASIRDALKTENYDRANEIGRAFLASKSDPHAAIATPQNYETRKVPAHA